MTTQSKTPIKRSDLLNRLVLDYSTTEEVGRVKQLWLDVKAHQVKGLTCSEGLLGRNKRSFTWAEIETIGTDSILVRTLEGAEPEKPESWESVVGHEMWTDAGNKVGSLKDYTIDPQTGAVIDYLFVSNGWRGVTDGIYRLPSTAIINVGRKRVIAIDAMVQNAEQYAEGLSHKIHKAAEFAKEDYTHTQQDLSAARQRTQAIATQLQQRTQKVRSQAKEKLSEVSSQLQQTTQQLTSQAKEKFSEVKTQLQGTSQSPTADTDSSSTPSETSPESESREPSQSTQ
ncbi:MAG: PRC-barrel domain-containing protein [Xenococcaceae cyanobacterium]